ncbi:unnamed protein product [Rhizophagus irregularis]|uniref:Uncharacterized protein n=1 Tax=Rhizophagus irregularis TaxID=588596 RepID=A0A916EHP3_9GLOM|nr:kinase-like domain-containing protein [Rhizophagus irregularis DAOM 181602=DAOM 197198]CAB4485684.1 unnamed protein product [Rhizophagus irregularis]CAB5389246.1 unnamed protein product [Rhizophagus irregularis]
MSSEVKIGVGAKAAANATDGVKAKLEVGVDLGNGPSATDVCEIFNSWSNMGIDAKYFNQAEEIRLELIKSKMLGDFNEKPHPKAIYTSRSLNTLTGSPSIIMFNMKPNNKLIEESISNKEYITKEYEFDINEI